MTASRISESLVSSSCLSISCTVEDGLDLTKMPEIIFFIIHSLFYVFIFFELLQPRKDSLDIFPW